MEKQRGQYLTDKQFNTKFYDILPYILVNVFCVKIRIVELKKKLMPQIFSYLSMVIKQGLMVSLIQLYLTLIVYLKYLRSFANKFVNTVLTDLLTQFC